MDEKILKLDLYNFVEPEAEDSSYILTSPRSLQACSKFGIKPVHLLPKTYEEFEEEYNGHKEIYIAYKKFEKDRLRRLHLCREERERIIDENEPVQISDQEMDNSGDDSLDTALGWKVLNLDKNRFSSRSDHFQEKPSILSYLDSNKITTPRISARKKDWEEKDDEKDNDNRQAFKLISADSEDSDIDFKAGSMSTKAPRTSTISWNKSSFTPLSIVKPLLDSSKESPYQTESHSTEHSATSSKFKPDTADKPETRYSKFAHSLESPRYDTLRSIEEDIFRQRLEKKNTSQILMSARPCSSLHSITHKSPKNMSVEMIDTNFESSRRMRRTTPQSTRKYKNHENSELSLETIANELPQNLLDNLSHMSVKDKKLLESMLHKASAEKLDKRSRNTLHKDNAIRQLSSVQMERRNDEYAKREEKQGNVIHRRSASDRKVQRLKEENFDLKHERSKSEYKKQTLQKEMNLVEKHTREKEKKRRQEENLRMMAQENEEWRQEIFQSERLCHLERKKKEFKNNLRSSFNQSEYEREKQSAQEELLQELEEKQDRAALQFQSMMKLKEYKRYVKSQKERDRKNRQKKQMEYIQQDLELWQKELKDYQDISIKKAEQKKEKRNNKRSQNIHIKRLQKEIEHMNLKQRLDEEEKVRQQKLKALIRLKDQRSQVINNEKEVYKQTSREAARASRAVRNFIKEKTFQNSFNKMAANAEKVARIDKLGKPKPTQSNSLAMKHTSHVLLG